MELIVAAALIVFSVIAVFLILRGRRPPAAFTVRETPIDLDIVWREWLQAEDIDDSERARRSDVWNDVPERTRADVLADLLDFERRALDSNHPLLMIRREIMDSIDRRMLNNEILALPTDLKQRLRQNSAEALQSDADAWLYIAANELRMEILRDYAGRRFGDRAENDWLSVYEKASRLKQRSVRHFLNRSLTGSLQEAEDARQQAISMVDGALRARLLEVRPGTEFKGLDDSHPG